VREILGCELFQAARDRSNDQDCGKWVKRKEVDRFVVMQSNREDG